MVGIEPTSQGFGDPRIAVFPHPRKDVFYLQKIRPKTGTCIIPKQLGCMLSIVRLTDISILIMVGERGIEPPTSCSQSRPSTADLLPEYGTLGRIRTYMLVPVTFRSVRSGGGY